LATYSGFGLGGALRIYTTIDMDRSAPAYASLTKQLAALDKTEKITI